MPIWSNPSDRFYHGPATYRLIVYGQNYCGKTFTFKPRMRSHKYEAKHWEMNLDEGKNVQDVYKAVAGNWDDVVIEIIARYPDKIKDVEADELFMCEREVEAVAFYDSYNNGLNMTPGGRFGSKRLLGNQHALGSTRTAAQKQAMSQRMKGNQILAEYNRRPEARAATSQFMMGKQHALGHRVTEAQRQAHSQLMRGHNFNADRRKSLTATMGDKTWKFESTYAASTKLEKELGESYGNSAISKACRGKFGSKKNLHIYKGIHFKYD